MALKLSKPSKIVLAESKKQSRLGGLKSLSSALLTRLSIAAKAGLQFDGDRDLYAVFGYKRIITFDHYLAKYIRQDIAARVIDAAPNATWRSPPTPLGSSEFIAAWDEFIRVHDIWNKLERVDRLAGLGQYAIILIGLDDGVVDLEIPVVPGPKREVLYLQPYSQGSVKIRAFNDDVNSSRYSKPETYEIQMSDPTKSSNTGVGFEERPSVTTTIRVHHTRILHVADSLLEDDVFGVPRMAKVYNLLDDIMKVAGGTAEVFWLTANRGMQANIDKDMSMNPADEAALDDEIKEYQHQLRRVIRTRGVEITNLGSDVPDPSGTFGVLMNLLSGATGIPQRILLGSEAGQLASEQDRANWAERMDERQLSFGEPKVLKPFVQALQAASVLPEDPTLEWDWPDAFKLSPLERDQKLAQYARAVVNLSRQTQHGRPLTTQAEDRVLLGLPAEGGPKTFDHPDEAKAKFAPEPEPNNGEFDTDEEEEGNNNQGDNVRSIRDTGSS